MYHPSPLMQGWCADFWDRRARAARRPYAGLPRISHRPWIRRTFMANIIEITDFSAPELDIYARLTEGQLLNRHEPDKGIFIAESPKVIERARLPCWKMS